MRYVGLLLLALAALLLTSLYRKRLLSRVATLEACLALAMHARSRVSGYLEPPSVWAESFSHGNGEVMALATRVREGEPPADAYLSAADGLSLSREAREALGVFFSELGRDGVDIERRSMDRGIDRISALLEKERDECAERGRIAAVMALMLSAGGAILII